MMEYHSYMFGIRKIMIHLVQHVLQFFVSDHKKPVRRNCAVNWK